MTLENSVATRFPIGFEFSMSLMGNVASVATLHNSSRVPDTTQIPLILSRTFRLATGLRVCKKKKKVNCCQAHVTVALAALVSRSFACLLRPSRCIVTEIKDVPDLYKHRRIAVQKSLDHLRTKNKDRSLAHCGYRLLEVVI